MGWSYFQLLSPAWEEHLKHLRTILQQLHAGLECRNVYTWATLLETERWNQTLKKSEQWQIIQFPGPRGKSEVFGSYKILYCRLVVDYTVKAVPLTDLTKKVLARQGEMDIRMWSRFHLSKASKPCALPLSWLLEIHFCRQMLLIMA